MQATIRQRFEGALALHRQGRLAEAERAYAEVLRDEPSHVEALHHLGVVLAQSQRPGQAVGLIEQVVAQCPDHAEAHLHLANALVALLRLEQAVSHFDRAAALKPSLAHAATGRAAALRQRGDLDALAAAAAGAGPQAAARLWRRAEALREQGLLAEALTFYDAALSAGAGDALLLSHRGNVLRELGRLEEALASHDRALAAAPATAGALCNRGIVLLDLGRPEPSLADCDHAIALDAGLAAAHFNRGNALRHLGRLEEAIAAYERAVVLQPRYPDALFNKALCHLLLGDFETGLPLYEHRRSLRSIAAQRRYAQPAWSGQDIRGKTLFIYHELYLGDMIQLCRYARLARERGARVLLGVQNRLHALLANLGEGIELVGENETPPTFDVHVPLLSLPLAFATRPATIPGGGRYLTAQPERVARWRERIGAGGFRIGLHWQGSALSSRDGRAIPLAAFAPLAALPGVRLISLQVGEGAEQIAGVPFSVETLGDDFDTGPDAFVDAAAAIENLDLVVSCDSAIAHLAGALGRPVWLALKTVPDWRWLMDREDTPWYPSMRLFRQRVRGDWSTVFDGMAQALATDLAARGKPSR